jgi:hypothetical protein
MSNIDHKVSKSEAGYQPPSEAPFECQNCGHYKFFAQYCELVEGKIEPKGCCNLFHSKNIT